MYIFITLSPSPRLSFHSEAWPSPIFSPHGDSTSPLTPRVCWHNIRIWSQHRCRCRVRWGLAPAAVILRVQVKSAFFSGGHLNLQNAVSGGAILNQEREYSFTSALTICSLRTVAIAHLFTASRDSISSLASRVCWQKTHLTCCWWRRIGGSKRRAIRAHAPDLFLYKTCQRNQNFALFRRRSSQTRLSDPWWSAGMEWTSGNATKFDKRKRPSMEMLAF